MPRAPRPGKATLYVEVPEELDRLLRERARQERRPLTTVVIMALEQYLGLSPGQSEAAPPPPAADQAGAGPSGEKPAPKSRPGKGRGRSLSGRKELKLHRHLF